MEREGYLKAIHWRTDNTLVVPVLFLRVDIGFLHFQCTPSTKIFVERRLSPVGRSKNMVTRDRRGLRRGLRWPLFPLSGPFFLGLVVVRHDRH